MSQVQDLFFKFSNGQGAGLIAVVVCAIISLIAIDFIWLRIVCVQLNARLVKRSTKVSTTREEVFFKTQLGVYIASLLLSNLLSTISYMSNVTWINRGGIQQGSLCSSQGALMQIGDSAAAYFTAAIAVHTFATLALGNRLPAWFCYMAVACGWILTIASGVIPSVLSLPNGPIYGTDGASCGISVQYPLVQTVVHLAPIFLGALISAVFYALVFLTIRGTIVFRKGVRFNLDPEARWQSQSGSFEYSKFIAGISQSMLWYPIVYAILMLPHVIVCLLETSGFANPVGFKIFSVACSALLGVANVIIFYNIMRAMSPAFRPSAARVQAKPDLESFGNAGVIEKEPSPVDVAPSVSAILAQRAFPSSPVPGSRALSVASPRLPSMVSVKSSESTQYLLRTGHTPSGSTASTVNSLSVAALPRAITPVRELNEMLSADSSRSGSPLSATSDDSQSSLPAPRREHRSPLLRRPTIPPPVQTHLEVPEPSHLTAVNLQTPAVTENKSRQSFINMYGSKSPQDTSPEGPRLTYYFTPETSNKNKSLRPSQSDAVLSQRFTPSITISRSPRDIAERSGSGSGSEQSSGKAFSSPEDVPLTPFLNELTRVTASATIPRDSFASRQSEAYRPSSSAGPSSLAFAAIMNNASRNEQMRIKATRRRSKSLEQIPKMNVPPPPTRPAFPMSAFQQEFTIDLIPGIRSAVPVRTSASLAALRNSHKTAAVHSASPSRVSTFTVNSPNSPRSYGYF
ncbi:hypothetical protein C8Q75DRAFT_809976 [Abortiporus biennis]|nr:hypothetical protein C8Q75DRAFT_809976 [Abortiporus biennis]